MKKWFYFIFVLVFVCCDNTIPTEEPRPEAQIEVRAFYVKESESSKYPDVGSQVFIFYDIYENIHYSYEEGGILIDNRNGNRITPDQQSVIDGFGETIIIPKYTDRKFHIIVASNYYPGRLGYVSYTERAFEQAFSTSENGIIRYTITYYP